MYSIQQFVLDTVKEKGISRANLVRKAGFVNIAKGCRRLDQFLTSENPDIDLIERICAALDVSPQDTAFQIVRSQIERQREIENQQKRKRIAATGSFVPFLYCQTERRAPSQITICALCGFDRLKSIYLPADFNDCCVIEQDVVCRNLILSQLERFDGILPTFGKIMCFTLKRWFDDCEIAREVYDLTGHRVRHPDVRFQQIHSGTASVDSNGNNLELITAAFRSPARV